MEKFREPRAQKNFSSKNGFAFKKLFRMVRFTLFCFFLSLVQIMAMDSYSQQTRLSLNQNNQRLEDVLRMIENKSEFFFMYNRDLIDVDQTVSINATNQTITAILDELLKGTDIRYSVFSRQIILSNLEGVSGLVTQQPKSVSGKVTDSSGSPLPGVSVVVKGTTTGTITDANGNYSLANIPDNATLQFSLVGMKSQEFSVAGKTTINATLVEDAIGIEEVVAVGYGTQKKGNLTGSIATVKNEDLVKTPLASTSNALAGRLPGVISKQGSGSP
ncbi:MAG: carboxypeptidase-like regulatory domain-containing protein, partial [Flavobacteriaceae bacterium]|nr:carboxypeptidase-like regulatory domain-containing protein [Flavobacteriaceae bacterium]